MLRPFWKRHERATLCKTRRQISSGPPEKGPRKGYGQGRQKTHRGRRKNSGIRGAPRSSPSAARNGRSNAKSICGCKEYFGSHSTGRPNAKGITSICRGGKERSACSRIRGNLPRAKGHLKWEKERETLARVLGVKHGEARQRTNDN